MPPNTSVTCSQCSLGAEREVLLPSSLPSVVESPLDPLPSPPSSLVSLHAGRSGEGVQVECWDIYTGIGDAVYCSVKIGEQYF